MNNFIEPELYKEVVKQTVLSCVDIIVISHGRYLIVKRKEEPAKEQWWFPGSRIRRNETMVDAVKRTCLEEVGLEVIPRRIIGVEETIFETGKFNGSTHSLNVVYLAESLTDYVKLDDNHESFEWISISHIPQYLPKYITDFVEQAFLSF